MESGAGVSCPATYRLLQQLEKAFPAVRLSGTDLRVLCSKITAQPSTAALMDMKQNAVWLLVQMCSTHECMSMQAGRKCI